MATGSPVPPDEYYPTPKATKYTNTKIRTIKNANLTPKKDRDPTLYHAISSFVIKEELIN
ncbi:hypothetical protein DZJ_16080 [Dickeya ananatis]